MCPPGRAQGGPSASRAFPLSIAERLNTMTTLMQASHQWATRPADERFTSLLDMQDFVTRQREMSRSTVLSTRKIEVTPDPQDPKMRGLMIGVDGGSLAGSTVAPTHWSFGQLCSRAA